MILNICEKMEMLIFLNYFHQKRKYNHSPIIQYFFDKNSITLLFFVFIIYLFLKQTIKS